MKRYATMVLLVGLATAGSPDAAQAQVSLELRAGGAVGNATPSAGGLGASPRPVLGIGAEAAVAGPLSVYAGYSRAAFGCERGFCAGQGVTFTSHGLAAGVRLHPAGPTWLRAGVLYHGLDTRTASVRESSGARMGYEVAAGLAFSPGARLRVLPGIVYRRHDATSGGIDGYAAVLSGEVGVQYRIR